LIVHEAGEDAVVFPLPNPQVGQLLWAIGDHTLNLSITGSGEVKGPFTTTATLVVVADGPTDSWWTWTEPTGGGSEYVFWPLPYSPLGSLVNRSQWSAMKVQCELLETDITDGGPQVSRGTASVTADIGPNPNPVQFGAITQNWTWVDTPTGRVVAPTTKQFDYVVNLSVQDAWGNSYSPVNTYPAAHVFVSVANRKLNDAWSALRCNAFAATAAATGAIVGIVTFGIGAAVGGAVAAALIAIGLAACR